MIITANHVIIFLLLLLVIGMAYAIYLLRIIKEFTEANFDMNVNIEEWTKPAEDDDEYLPLAN